MDILTYALAVKRFKDVLDGGGRFFIKSISFRINEDGELQHQVVLHGDFIEDIDFQVNEDGNLQFDFTLVND